MEMTVPQLLILAFCVFLLCLGLPLLLVRYLVRESRADPRFILSRCKAKLKTVRRDLDRIPVTREIHRLYSEIDQVERIITLAESGFDDAEGE
jgi:hypothetical protein